MKKLLAVLAIAGLAGCGSLSKVDVCSAIDMVKLGHLGAAGVSAAVCNALKGEKRTRCLAERDRVVKSMDALLLTADVAAKKCEAK